ncbi:MAG: M23 family metallopeptidase [Lachnospiraceae bacterium]|nr:M23 family metallopeptidase [Lachnospiraceae bacterium]
MSKSQETKLYKGKTVLALALGAVVAVTAIVAVQVTKEKENQAENLYENRQEESLDLTQGLPRETTTGNTFIQVETSIDSIGDAALVDAETTIDMSNIMDATDETLANLVEQETEETERNTERREEQIDLAQETESAAGEGTVQVDVSALALSFTKESRMSWPVEGDVISSFSMNGTVYFPTLDQYKYNPAMLIRSDVNTPVLAAADGVVLEVSSNEEIGEYVRVALGNEYELVYGQLKAIEMAEGEMVTKGQVLGYVSEPTKYYTVEGNHLYLKMTEGQEALDPLDYLE